MCLLVVVFMLWLFFAVISDFVLVWICDLSAWWFGFLIVVIMFAIGLVVIWVFGL